MKARHHLVCRVCGSTRLLKYIDLGLLPLANNLEATSSAARASERFPLQVLFCENCYLSQLSMVVDPSVLYLYYTYRSGVNQSYVTHCRQMAAELQERYGLTADCFQVDIAGNDGTLLRKFRDEIGLKVLNVDPASNLTAVAEQAGIESLAASGPCPFQNRLR